MNSYEWQIVITEGTASLVRNRGGKREVVEAKAPLSALVEHAQSRQVIGPLPPNTRFVLRHDKAAVYVTEDPPKWRNVSRRIPWFKKFPYVICIVRIERSKHSICSVEHRVFTRLEPLQRMDDKLYGFPNTFVNSAGQWCTGEFQLLYCSSPEYTDASVVAAFNRHFWRSGFRFDTGGYARRWRSALSRRTRYTVREICSMHLHNRSGIETADFNSMQSAILANSTQEVEDK